MDWGMASPCDSQSTLHKKKINKLSFLLNCFYAITDTLWHVYVYAACRTAALYEKTNRWCGHKVTESTYTD